MKDEKNSDRKTRRLKQLVNASIIVLIIFMSYRANPVMPSIEFNIPSKTVKATEQIVDKDVEEKGVHDYLQRTKGLSKEMGKALADITGKGAVDNLTDDDIVNLNHKVMKWKDMADTTEPFLFPFRGYYYEQIDLCHDIIEGNIKNKNSVTLYKALKIEHMRKKYNKHIKDEQKIILSLLDKANIYYEVKKGGELYYHL